MRIGLRLAGVSFDVTLTGPVREESVVARYGAYVDAPTGDGPRVSLTVDVRADAARLPQPPEVAWPGALGRREGDGRVRFTRRGLDLAFDPVRATATATAAPGQLGLDPVVDPTPLDTPLRLLLTYELARRGGAMVHACGFGDARGAVLFAGESGAGKTTTSRKLPPANVLSDDQVALTREGAGWTAHALPFVGEYARATAPRSTRLRALLLLTRGPGEARTRPLAGAATVVRVVRCLPWYARGDAAGAGLADVAAGLVEGGLVRELALARDAPVEALLAALLA